MDIQLVAVDRPHAAGSEECVAVIQHAGGVVSGTHRPISLPDDPTIRR